MSIQDHIFKLHIAIFFGNRSDPAESDDADTVFQKKMLRALSVRDIRHSLIFSFRPAQNHFLRNYTPNNDDGISKC